MDHLDQIGLVVQGGAMTTAYAVGALAELDALGLREKISVGAGVSAGAMALSAFATGNATEALTVFLDVLPTRRFINPLRLHRIVDVDYLVDVLSSRIITNIEAQLGSTFEVFAAVTLVESGSPLSIPLNGPLRRDDPKDVLRASAAIPVLYGKRISLSVGECVDGGISNILPLFDVLEHGPGTVIVISTTADSVPIDFLSWYERLGIAFSPGVPRVARRELLSPNPLNRLVERVIRQGHFGGTKIVCITPSDPSRLVYKTSLDRNALESSAKMGREDARIALATAGLR